MKFAQDFSRVLITQFAQRATTIITLNQLDWHNIIESLGVVEGEKQSGDYILSSNSITINDLWRFKLFNNSIIIIYVDLLKLERQQFMF